MAKDTLIVAQFDNSGSLLHAAEASKSTGYTLFEAYSPFPIHGMDHAMALKKSSLGWLSLTGGLIGCITGLSLQVWSASVAYPLIISGKPLNSYPAFIPVIFELTILFTAFFTVFGMFALNKIPEFYHTIFNHSTFHKVTCDGFFLSIDVTDPHYNGPNTTKFLTELGGKNIEIVGEIDEH